MSLSQRPFSASLLSAFDACPRRVAWGWGEGQPSFVTQAPSEGPQVQRLGSWLHALAEWHGKGFDVAPLLAKFSLDAPSLAPALEGLWAAFLERPEATASPCWTELQLQVPLAPHQAIAKLDCVVKEGDTFWIVDWKTGQLSPELLNDWQAWLYPYALVEAGASLNQGKNILPEQVGMRFVGLATGKSLELRHSAERHTKAHARLSAAVLHLHAKLEAHQADAKGLRTGWCQRSNCPFISRCQPHPHPQTSIPPTGTSAPEDEQLPSLGGPWDDAFPAGEHDEFGPEEW